MVITKAVVGSWHVDEPDKRIESEYSSFHKTLDGLSASEKLSLYDRKVEELELKLREDKMGYEQAKELKEFLDEPAIELYQDGLQLLIDKLRLERDRLIKGEASSTPPHAPSSADPPASTPIPRSPVFSTAIPVDRNKLTVEQAAEYLGIKKQTLYQWCSEKKIPFRKVGSKTFFDAGELDGWVAKHHVKPVGETTKARTGRT